ncbi:hypothetical protein Bca4012_065054 [Brassica carinata]
MLLCLPLHWWRMTLFRFFNCAILTFGPHAIYYSATPLYEYDTLGTSVKVAVVYLATALVKEALKTMIGFIDVAGLYFALAQLAHRNISQNHKFQAVGLGWAFADAVLHRLAPLWVGARGLEFTWGYVLQGLEANANLVFTISLAALDVNFTVDGFHQLSALHPLSETVFVIPLRSKDQTNLDCS